MRAILGWFRRNRTSLVLALALGVLSLSTWYFLLPTWLTVAVTADQTQEARALAAYARRLDQQKKNARVSLVSVAGYAEAADALERGSVDLALVRPDIAYPSNGLTMVVLREEALLHFASDLDLAVGGIVLLQLVAEEFDPAFWNSFSCTMASLRRSCIVSHPPNSRAAICQKRWMRWLLSPPQTAKMQGTA